MTTLCTCHKPTASHASQPAGHGVRLWPVTVPVFGFRSPNGRFRLHTALQAGDNEITSPGDGRARGRPPETVPGRSGRDP